MAKRCRVAFLTPEFVTEGESTGGLANYLDRMTQALVAEGHAAEVFVLSEKGSGVVDHHGVRVMRVGMREREGWWKWGRVAARLPVLRGYRPLVQVLSGASLLAAALEEREKQKPFDVVQSSDYFATGRYVKARAGRVHVVRCSGARELFAAVDHGDSRQMRRWWVKLEREAVERAEIAYAPSRFVAEFYAKRLGRNVEVVRPVASVEVMPVAPRELPERFLLHFGQLRCGKGTRWMLEALGRAWEMEPGLRMVLVGPFRDSRLARDFRELSTRENRVMHIAGMEKGEIYGTVQRAVATVLPSLVDNLPNTVIESLMLGTPVVGSRGASIDELVEEGVTGELVEIGDVAGLARAMVRAWRGEWGVRNGFAWESGVAKMMRPEEAVRRLLDVAGLGDGGGR